MFSLEDYEMKKTYHELICIIDRSGSMESIRDDAIGGFNAFITEQKKEPEPTLVTLELFDDQFDRIYEAMPIDEISSLDKTLLFRGDRQRSSTQSAGRLRTLTSE